MSLQVAIPLGIASALVYGTSIVVQHDVAHQQGETDAKGLVALLRNPRWLLAIGGDLIGFLLQIGALATGPVVLIQPLVVLMLPVALIAGYLMGGPRPSMLDYAGSALIIGGLGAFLAIVGQPAPSRVPGSRFMAMVILVVLTVGVIATISVQRAASVVRGALFGTVAGAYFGTLGVMVDAASERAAEGGLHALFRTGRGLVPLIGIVVLGVGGIVLTQISFQIGALGATLPANIAADPFTAVVIGALLLREHVPLSALHLFGYALCLAAVIAGAVRLADAATGRRSVGATGSPPASPDTDLPPATMQR